MRECERTKQRQRNNNRCPFFCLNILMFRQMSPYDRKYRGGGLYMGCVIFQCYPYGLANANAENFNGGRTSSRVRHGFNCQQLRYMSIAPVTSRIQLIKSHCFCELLQHLPTFLVANSCNMLCRCPYRFEE